MSFPVSSRAYSPSNGTSSIPEPYFSNVPPTNRNTQFPLGQIWIDQSASDTWQLLSFSTQGGTLLATWQRTASGTGGAIYSITGNIGGPTTADSNGNLSLLGFTGISFAGGGSNLISATITGGGFGVVDVTTGTQTLAANNMYIVDFSSGLVTFTLPTTAVQGDTYIIHGKSSLGWVVNVATGQTLHLGNRATTASTGSIASTDQWDSVTITCVTDAITFACRAVQGNILVS